MATRHVRILTALFAAIILHALLLSWSLPSSNSITINDGLMQVDLLKADKPSVARPASPPRAIADAQPKRQQKAAAQVKRAKHQQTSQPTRTVIAIRQLTPGSALVKSHVSEKKSHPPHHAETTQVADHRPVNHGESATRAPSMAAGVQTMLLANIHYPAQARRHGWQGAGEFQLDIDSQSIRKITMLMSTGHAILDRAVRRGLGSIEHVPVANGQYRLPVEFRLQ